MPIKNMLISALLLGLFAVAGSGLVGLTHVGTLERIAENERQALLKSLHALIPPGKHDNDIYSDVIEVTNEELLGSKRPISIYRARMGGSPVAAVLTPGAPDGYGGEIKLLVAINYDSTLAGVRVITHKETPGLGDAIEVERNNWILGFNGRSLTNPVPGEWKVKKDGGIFDQFTGATITPRAVVKAVYNSLRYYQLNRDALYRPAKRSEEASDE
jgi:electron transport complex protein RnfG